MKNVIKPLGKSILIPLGLTAEAAAAEAVIHKEILGSIHHPSYSTSQNTTTLIISNDVMEDIIEIVKSLENSDLLLNEISEIIQNESKEQNG